MTIYNKMFAQNNILELALQASSLKNDVIQNNIANADVPNYKKRTVNFENVLKDAIDSSKITGKLDLNSIKPTVEYDNSNFSYRYDKNNVDVEAEMVGLAQNSAKYDFLVSGVMSNFKRMNLVFNAR